ncbi:hypothetical protein [Staphylococcus gallinarum]|uniref:hypothetical protein n=1 Tax=Staphylococcus gallinarum TaxID=1293 RepID=UPI00317032BB
MKQHKFKRMAHDLIDLIPNDRFQVDYKYNVIWFSHFNKVYKNGVAVLQIDNNIHSESEMLIHFELAKKVVKGECLIDEGDSDLPHQT